MPAPPTYARLFKSVTLGTVRRPPEPEVLAWLDELGAIDPTADEAEQLLVALGLAERMHRMRLATSSVVDTNSGIAPPEESDPPPPKLARGLQLILEGTYPELLDEAVDLVLTQGTFVPPQLLPLLIPRAAAFLSEDYTRAQRYLDAGGKRGRWLAAQHPDWALLTPTYSFATAWSAAEQPARQAEILSAWRRVDAQTARRALEDIWDEQSPRNQEVLLDGLQDSLEEPDHAWLRERLQPKRKGVRRRLTELLLLAREPQTVADFQAIAINATAADGSIAANPPSGEMRDLLKQYGGVKAPESLAQRLLEILPPEVWSEVVNMPLPRFWLGLRPLELRAASRSILAFSNADLIQEMVRFLLQEEPKGYDMELAGRLVQALDRESFNRLYDELLTKEKDALRLRGFSRYLALQRREAWSERLSKAMVTRLLEDLHNRQLDYATQRDLGLHWKLAVPLLDTAIFPWLRRQLHTTTERYDAFGKLATRMLQVTSFRRQLHGE
ncbi:DUF5691 domain-containing protein [Lewinella sp. IMCC34191]|uniref:DUF5691 domain-containing protein n=1 Tax=Lewinella sp. IMCC34191 TaxID=2259172 RepID=UPI000E25CC53|nr:DUF5691 domain-containing protein [Lewinella sp. IMCC34191]